MLKSSLAIPRHVIQQRIRLPKPNIPQTGVERSQFLQFARHYVAEYNPVPPLPLEELRTHAERVVGLLKCNPAYTDYLGVLINNEMWRESVAGIPYHKRLLLLPKCLRVESKCTAPFDEFGLLCKQCGLCSIQDLQAEAERLGYAVLVAEGSGLVMSLIQTGKIEAIVGVSCLSVLERAFPFMEGAAIPGAAIPLLQDDCRDTSVDLDWIWEYIHLTSADQTRRLDLGALRDEVDNWFTAENLERIMGAADGDTERIAREWLTRAGKRWRPFLAVAAYKALCGDTRSPLPEDVRKIAVAVECFHKASLVHDDIEDNDRDRYGEKTLHEQYGIPVALNVGDLLIGEGYRLIGTCQASSAQKAGMLLAAAQGQRQLCRGQGAELCWAREPEPLSPTQVLDIFRRKTAPAFEVALQLGAIYAGLDHHEEVSQALGAYSAALGIAYQIRDDLSDWETKEVSNDLQAMRPSLLLAIAHERARGETRDFLKSIWGKPLSNQAQAQEVEKLCIELKADERARILLETYKEEATRSLRALENANLKGLLRRVIGKIFNGAEIKGWCKEFEARNLGGETSAGNPC